MTDFYSDKLPPKEVQALCHEFFQSKVSDLSTCFPRVPKHNFMRMCMNSTNTLEACRSAVGYIEMCHRQHTPLNIPDSCIRFVWSFAIWCGFINLFKFKGVI